ncbi:MAG: hypothetical protein OEX01_08550 [Candidatus Bathyarchaeota archaeon]|nr:hypothetical protein [Candidatus Bathyarchaeota archaeon]
MGESGVRIKDNDNGIIAELFFKPEGIRCSYCGEDQCRHVQFGLSAPAIQKVIHKKREEGWRLPEV